MKYINKSTFVVSFGLSVAIFLFFEVNRLSVLCSVGGNYIYLCRDVFLFLKFISVYLTISMFPGMLTIFFKGIVFEAWKKFAVMAIPIVLLISYFITQIPTSGFVDARPVFYMALLYGSYFLVSFVIIGLAWYRNRKKI